MIATLPWPPSVNRYWRHVGRRVLISREGRTFRRDVCALLGGSGRPPRSGRVALAMDAFPPDRRRRDLDNLQKATCDSLAYAGVYEDDSQIDILFVRRCEVVRGGRIEIRVHDIPLRRCPLCGGPIESEN